MLTPTSTTFDLRKEIFFLFNIAHSKRSFFSLYYLIKESLKDLHHRVKSKNLPTIGNKEETFNGVYSESLLLLIKRNFKLRLSIPNSLEINPIIIKFPNLKLSFSLNLQL